MVSCFRATVKETNDDKISSDLLSSHLASIGENQRCRDVFTHTRPFFVSRQKDSKSPDHTNHPELVVLARKSSQFGYTFAKKGRGATALASENGGRFPATNLPDGSQDTHEKDLEKQPTTQPKPSKRRQIPAPRQTQPGKNNRNLGSLSTVDA